MYIIKCLERDIKKCITTMKDLSCIEYHLRDSKQMGRYVLALKDYHIKFSHTKLLIPCNSYKV